MSTDARDISTLNTLIAATVDSAKAFARAASMAAEPARAETLQSDAHQREVLVTDMQSWVMKLGAVPEEEGTAVGTIRRVVMGASCGEPNADQNLEEATFATDHRLLRRIDDAIGDDEVSVALRRFIATRFEMVRAHINNPGPGRHAQ